MNRGQFENLTASTLYCTRCRAAQPVFERLLLVLPGREIHGYFCRVCGQSLGEREVSELDSNGGSGGSGLILP